MKLASRDLDPVLDEIVDRYRAMGRSRPGDTVSAIASVDTERPPPGIKPAWERRPEIRADGPPNLLLRNYLATVRLGQKYFRYEVEGYEHIRNSPSALIVAYAKSLFSEPFPDIEIRMRKAAGIIVEKHDMFLTDTEKQRLKRFLDLGITDFPID